MPNRSAALPIHTSGATVVDRVEFAQRVAARFGDRGETTPVRTAGVRLLAPQTLRSGLNVDRNADLLWAKVLRIDAALDRSHCEWRLRTAT